MSSAAHPKDVSSATRDLGITGIHHVGISTLDLDRLVAFYLDTFGFEQIAEFDWEPGFTDVDAALALDGSRGSMAMLRLGDIHLELFEFSNPLPQPVDPAHSVTDIGINHLCLLVDDVGALFLRLEEQGIPVHSTPRDIGDGPFVYCRDPDGNAIEFWQRPPGKPEEKT